MKIFVYDNTFDGFLSLVFDSYKLKIIPEEILSEDTLQEDLLADIFYVKTDFEKSDRVWKGLTKKLSKQGQQIISFTYHAKVEKTDMLLFQYICFALNSKDNIELNFRESCVLELTNTYRKVLKESMRIVQFSRFQKTTDNIYFASFDPKYNVLPIAVNHFKNRYPNEKWIIYDTKRNYGIYNDGKSLSKIELSDSPFSKHTGKLKNAVTDSENKLFEIMWQNYCKSATIKERKNLRLQMQFMPKRFWKYLPERSLLQE